jgi:hypothetical protein
MTAPADVDPEITAADEFAQTVLPARGGKWHVSSVAND